MRNWIGGKTLFHTDSTRNETQQWQWTLPSKDSLSPAKPSHEHCLTRGTLGLEVSGTMMTYSMGLPYDRGTFWMTWRCPGEIDIDPPLGSVKSTRGDKHLSTNKWIKHGKVSVMRKVLRRYTKEKVKADDKVSQRQRLIRVQDLDRDAEGKYYSSGPCWKWHDQTWCLNISLMTSGQG